MRIFAILCLLVSSHAIGLPNHQAIPGGLWKLDLPNSEQPPRVALDGKPVMTVRSQKGWHALIGIPLTQNKSITVTVNNAAVTLDLKPHPYAEQRLTVKRKHVEPSPQALQRIQQEFAQMTPIYRGFSTNTLPTWPEFRWPITGPVSSPFGLRRFFNEQPRKPHSGIDIAAAKGTPIQAPANGKVVLVGDFYFNGNSVFIDHGQGLISMMCHMDSISVNTGDIIAAGTIIGTVGATGRATGPHLHWTVSLNNARIDPTLVVGEPMESSRRETSSQH